MPEPEPKLDPETEFFSQLYDALTDEPRQIQELRESLKARGIDVDRMLDMARQLIADHGKSICARTERSAQQ